MIGCRWLMDRRDEAAGVARNQRRLIVTKFSWRKATLVAAVVPMLALSACSSTGGKPADSGNAAGGGQAASTSRIKVALITHAAAGDTFWDIVRKGAEEASAKDNVELLYTSDPEAGRQAQLIQQAIDQKVDGIAVTLAKPEALKDVLKKASDAGIPIVSLNAGESVSSQLGAFTHFGSNEQLAGQAIDYKDTATLRKFISERGKIRARRVTGLSVQEQRRVAIAIKNAREVALLPYASTAR